MTKLHLALGSVALIGGLTLVQAWSPTTQRGPQPMTGRDRGALVFLYAGADGVCHAKAGPETIAGKKNDKVVIDIASQCAGDWDVRVTFPSDVTPSTDTSTVKERPGKGKMRFTITGTGPATVHYAVEFRKAGSADPWVAAQDPDLEIYVRLDANPGTPLASAAANPRVV